jgi:CelD/BcsL family acetyltransferase involved in cellulose biosynthesis
MEIVEINKFKDFIALKDAWNKILKYANVDVFSTWEWLSTWWKYFGKNKKLLILIAKENDRIVGIAPLMYSIKRVFGTNQNIIEFIGSGYSHTGYNDFIILDQYEKCANLFFDYLNNISEDWIYTKLVDIPEKSKSLIPLSMLSKRTDISHECLIIPLPESFSVFLKTIQSRARKSFNAKLRSLNNNFVVKLVDYSNLDSVTQGMNILFNLHQERWRLKGRFKGMFADPRFKDFSLDIAKIFSEKGWLGLYALELSGKTVAILYGFRYNSKYYSNIGGLNSEFLIYDIGILLRFLVMEKCIKDKFVEYDFLWGTDFWKKRFRPKLKYTYKSIVSRKKLSAKIKVFLYTKYQNGKKIVNRRLQKFF